MDVVVNCCPGFAWVHFRQFAITRELDLVSKTKALLRRLSALAQDAKVTAPGAIANGSYSNISAAATAAAAAATADAPSGAVVQATAASNGVPAATAALSAEDTSLIRELGGCVINWISDRLGDYHQKMGAFGGHGAVAGFVEVLVFAARSRGSQEEEVEGLLMVALHSSVDKGGWGYTDGLRKVSGILPRYVCM